MRTRTIVVAICWLMAVSDASAGRSDRVRPKRGKGTHEWATITTLWLSDVGGRYAPTTLQIRRQGSIHVRHQSGRKKWSRWKQISASGRQRRSRRRLPVRLEDRVEDSMVDVDLVTSPDHAVDVRLDGFQHTHVRIDVDGATLLGAPPFVQKTVAQRGGQSVQLEIDHDPGVAPRDVGVTVITHDVEAGVP